MIRRHTLLLALMAALAGVGYEFVQPAVATSQTGYICGMQCVNYTHCEYGQPDISCRQEAPYICIQSSCPF